MEYQIDDGRNIRALTGREYYIHAPLLALAVEENRKRAIVGRPKRYDAVRTRFGRIILPEPRYEVKAQEEYNHDLHRALIQLGRADKFEMKHLEQNDGNCDC